MKRLLTMLKIESKLAIRCPDGIIFGVVMPVGVLLLLGMIAGGKSVSADAGYTFLDSGFAALITVGICATAFMGIPLTLADYRDKKILKHYFVTPVSPAVIFLVQIAIAMLTAIVSAVAVGLAAVLI